jgi:hypothetical protein
MEEAIMVAADVDREIILKNKKVQRFFPLKNEIRKSF